MWGVNDWRDKGRQTVKDRKSEGDKVLLSLSSERIKEVKKVFDNSWQLVLQKIILSINWTRYLIVFHQDE